MTVTNNTWNVLTLATQSNPYGHWQQQPTPSLAVGQSVTVSDESANVDGAQISLTYVTPQSVSITVTSTTPFVGSDGSGGTVTYPTGYTSPPYQVLKNSPSGFHSTDNFVITEGQMFSMTGSPQTYKVPAGINQVAVNAVGGSGGGYDGGTGAHVTGVLAVTPEEVLTIGAGGSGPSCGAAHAGGGFGIELNGNNYGGGAGASDSGESACGASGGGASVVADGSGTVVAVAGGGGGAAESSGTGGFGGSAGYQGSLTGQNGGNYDPGIAGAAAGTTGQSSAAASWPGGAGGGGLRGGTAGIEVERATNSGGGSGSSFNAGLTNPTISTTMLSGDGYVTVTPLAN